MSLVAFVNCIRETVAVELPPRDAALRAQLSHVHGVFAARELKGVDAQPREPS